MKYIIGVDGGTQSTKVTIFDLEGNSVAQSTTQLSPLYVPNADIAEHPNDDLWDSLKVTCKKLMAEFTGDPADILGIGLGSIRCCRTYLKKDGTLAYPVISWMDKRLAKAYQGDVPEMQYISTTTGYLTCRMTGEFKDTSANYEGVYGPFNKETWAWSDDPDDYKPYNITRENLLDLVHPGELLGRVTAQAAEATGLPEGCAVYATANDKAAEGLGAGVRNDGSCLVSLGTYIGGMMHGGVFNDGANHYWSNLAAVPHTYLYETMQGIRRGMWSISWFKELLGEDYAAGAKALGMGVEDRLEQEAKLIGAGSDGLIAVGEFLSPNNMPYRKATFIGFDGRHKRAHMYRAILESIAMTMCISVKAMCKELDVPLEKIIVSGGGSNSPLFMQIFADVFGVPSMRNVVNNAAGLGAAMNAAVGAGVYPDYDTAIDKMVRIRDSFSPDLDNTAVYDRVIDEIYRDIKTNTDPINQKIYDIFG